MNITLKKESGKPLYMSLYESISREIYTGGLRFGAKLTPRRELARELGISENTVDSAYKMLVDTGYVKSIVRQGYIVSFKGEVEGDSPWERGAPEQVVFSPNGIDTSKINRGAYAKILRDIAYNEGAHIFSYPEKGGEFALRQAIAKYLYSFRDIKCSPEQIIIGAGAEYMLLSLAAVFKGGRGIITENPCDAHFYRPLIDNNISVTTLPVNIGDFDFNALYRAAGSVLFAEPDARFPRGSAMDESERARLLDWADGKKGYIIENGADSGICYDRHRTLYSMDTNNRVIYLGSFARSFGPAMKISYMVLPYELMEMWKGTHAYYYSLAAVTEQLALAEFINRGYYTKHCRAMRLVYHEKKLFLSERLNNAGGGLIDTRLSCGSTYVTAECPIKTAEEIKALARRCGVKLLSMNSFNVYKKEHPIENDRLVIGCGDLTRGQIKDGVRLLELNLDY